ncbi:MAG: hypothetical protein HQ514_10890 [Rhodospirillales bacterium]|nr:hypothetical protein [Rhodospirillales bacterium]
MQNNVWLGAEAQKVTWQLAQRCNSKIPIIPIITEISVLQHSNCAPVRNIDVFNLQDSLIERLCAGISHKRIALDQWIGFERALGGASRAQIRVYMRSLLTATELPFMDHTVLDLARELARDGEKCLRIGHGPGAVIDFRLHSAESSAGYGGDQPRSGWQELVPLIQILRRRRPGTFRHTETMVRPRWLLKNPTGLLRRTTLAPLNPADVSAYLRGIECGDVPAPHEAVLGLALVTGKTAIMTPSHRPQQREIPIGAESLA